MGEKERMEQYRKEIAETVEKMEQNRKEILEMVEEIQSEKTMNLIYWYVKRGYNEERAREEPAP